MNRLSWKVEPVALAGALLIILQMCCTFWWKFSPQTTAEFMTSATTVMGMLVRQSVVSPETIHRAGETVPGLVARAAANTVAAESAMVNGDPPAAQL